ncbi:hypothetical protein IFM89_001350 [Coptis chinensis]|uniref:CDP-diacylglycerol--inositol 3-phosphatidyltransferase n=1 Tax=Coptis chinensis TaxID=261450 RepID=A0A835LQ89_9MAGN|nr:hypothetical protein IFM89_001350 [Coptis chinensis]
MENTSTKRPASVYLYIPNIIGYIRILMNCVAFARCFTDKKLFSVLYFISFICDGIDGWFARRFNQAQVENGPNCLQNGPDSFAGYEHDGLANDVTSAVLCGLFLWFNFFIIVFEELLTSIMLSWSSFNFWCCFGYGNRQLSIYLLLRVSTACLLAVLSQLYRPGLVFLSLLALDITSHWLQMYSTFLSGKVSHKDVKDSTNWLFKAYYGNRYFMGYCCLASEVLYIILFLLVEHQSESVIDVVVSTLQQSSLLIIPFAFVLFGWAIKQAVNVIQVDFHDSHCLTVYFPRLLI